MDSQEQSTIRTAAYLAAQQRNDARGALTTRTGKTRRGVQCTPPNKKCGNRCIPPNWDCRLEGKGTNSELQAHRTDPLAGIASIQRGAKDLARGVVTLNPSRVQRGRNSLIRGAVKLAPGDNLEQKKQLKRQLTAASTPVMAVLGVTLVGLGAHAGLKRGFASYRNGVGAQIDGAAVRAVDSVLDRIPGVADVRASRRAAAAGAAAEIATAVNRGSRIQATQAAAAGNLGRIGPLSFRPNAADYEASNLRSNLDTLQARARSGSLTYDTWRQEAVQTLYGAKSPGTRAGSQRGSIFSEHAANEFLVSQFGLRGTGAVGSQGQFSMAARNALVDTQLAERLGSWGETLRQDMRLRRFVGPDGGIRTEDVNRYIREVGDSTLNSRFAGLSVGQRNQARVEATRLMRSAINGTNMTGEARSIRRGLVAQYDTYFEGVAQGMRRNAAASDSPFGDGLAGLARYVGRTTNQPTQILSRDHADLVLRNHYHTRVMRLNNDFTIGEGTARRVAQQISRSTELPDTDSAFRILNENGFPRLSRRAPATGRAPERLRNLTELTRDILGRPGNEGMTRAAAQREARRLIERRQRGAD
jgi:hypothetical protein